MYMCTTFVQCPQKPKESVRSPETEVTDTCELNSDHLQKQHVLLTTELSLQSPTYILEQTFHVKMIQRQFLRAHINWAKGGNLD